MAVANAPLSMPVTKSPWHSPVPYLFGGLAAMLGLIAFALLILACSYWKLSTSLESGQGMGERDLEAGADDAGRDLKPKPVLEDKFLVIMAGEEKPSYLATPMSSRTSSFGSNTSCNSDATTSSSEKSNQADDESEVQVQIFAEQGQDPARARAGL